MEESVADTRPDDLITATEAATRAAKSKASIRNWVRLGKLTGYRKDPEISNSPLMISQAELRAYLAINGKITRPNTQGRKSDKPASFEALKSEIYNLKKQLAEKELELEHLRELTRMSIAHTERMQASSESHISHLRAELESQSNSLKLARQKNDEAAEKHMQLLRYVAQPWWKRMTSSHLLTG